MCQTPEQWEKVGFEERLVSVHTWEGAGICMAIQWRHQDQIQCSPGLMAILKITARFLQEIWNMQHSKLSFC